MRLTVGRNGGLTNSLRLMLPQGQMYTTRYILFRPGWLGENQYNTSSVASYHYAAHLVSSWFVGSLTLTKIQLDRNLSILTDITCFICFLLVINTLFGAFSFQTAGLREGESFRKLFATMDGVANGGTRRVRRM